MTCDNRLFNKRLLYTIFNITHQGMNSITVTVCFFKMSITVTMFQGCWPKAVEQPSSWS